MSPARALRRLFKPKTRELPRVPDGVTVYAVGDIHGRADLLEPVLERIRLDAASHDNAAKAVFVGDYVDRGPRSREVIDLLLDLKADARFETRFLRGNHDQSVLEFLFDPSTGPTWCDFGGRETLMSYGVTAPRSRTDIPAWVETAQAFGAALPSEHLAFFQALELSCEIGDYLFVHAGLRPGVAIAAQAEQDLMWIRQPFLDDPRPFAKVVVHGHTPTETVHADRRRIGVDTGAYATDVLTALCLQGEDRGLIQTRRRPDRTHEIVVSPVVEAGRA
jgi:serine/threonine protein phosphatase 1